MSINENKSEIQPIYFDNASTTKTRKEVMEKAVWVMENCYGNPSSLHNMGFEAEKEVSEATRTIAGLLKVNPDEIYYTSGGTESNNLAIFGAAALRQKKCRHIITARTEHPSVYHPVEELEKKGYEVTYLSVDHNGLVNIDQLKNALREDTLLVSLMYVNNETGAIQNIPKIGQALKGSSAVFHVDGVQAFGKIPVDLKNVDAFSFSGHKIQAMKGIGGLYIKKGTKINPVFFGGGQQKGIRPGTENTVGIITLGYGAKLMYDEMEENYKKVSKVKDILMKCPEVIEEVSINGSPANSSPYILNMSFKNIRGEVLLHALEEEGIFVSTGSACSSNYKENVKNNTLANMGFGKEIYESALRFSFYPGNRKEEAEKTIEVLKKHVGILRKYTRR